MDAEHPKTEPAAAPAETETPAGGPDGRLPDMRRRFAGIGPQSRLSDDEVHAIMAGCARFLWQLTMLTSGMLHTMDVGCVRNVIAADVPVPKRTVDENGKVLEQARPAGEDHRKAPRGRKHPLTVWLGLTLQGVRMLLRMTEGTHPEAFNRENVLDRIDREQVRASEREFTRMLNGR